MNLTPRTFLIILTLLTLLVGGVGAGVLHLLTPERYFNSYPLIPTYFYLYGILYIYLCDLCQRRAPQKMVLLFMAMKGIKLILSVLLLLIYMVTAPDSAVAFLLTFLTFYLVYLVFESCFSCLGEWKKNLLKKSKTT